MSRRPAAYAESCRDQIFAPPGRYTVTSQATWRSRWIAVKEHAMSAGDTRLRH